MFVITNDDMTKFVAIDQSSGGYPFVTAYFGKANLYPTKQDAQKEIDDKFMAKYHPEANKIARVTLKIEAN